MSSPVCSQAEKVAVDSLGNVYVLGDFATSMSIGNRKLVGSGRGKCMFVAKFGNSGALQWLQQPSGEVVALGALGVSRKGDVYVAGWFANSLFLGMAWVTGYRNRLRSEFIRGLLSRWMVSRQRYASPECP